MKVSGFSIIMNGETFDYPYLESLRSLLPSVDELVINVGKCEGLSGAAGDRTLEKVRQFAEREGQGKVQWFESHWPMNDPLKKRGGLILSEQTNLALDRCTGDWCVYLQGDEVLHQDELGVVRDAIGAADGDASVDGLLFDYVHFYGSFEVMRQTRSAYRREVRAFRKASGARSVGDAQSFRKSGGKKLRVLRSGARIYHYGWVRPPETMREKTYFFDQLYHGDPKSTDSPAGVPHTGDNYRYKRIWGLRRFCGSHPEVMRERIQAKGWHWDLDNSPFEWKLGDLKKIALDLFERATGYRLFEYRSYLLIPGKGKP